MLKEQVYLLLKQIPRGKVTTYKELAIALGNPKLARAVGNALNKNRDLDNIPCYKVVKSNGEIGGFAFGQEEKIARLKKDEVVIDKGKVDLSKFLFKF